MKTKWRAWSFMIVVAIGVGMLWTPALSLAHPLGNFSISHYSRLQITPEHVDVRYRLDLAEIPTFQTLQKSGMTPEAGHPSVTRYLAEAAAAFKEGLILEIDGQPLALRVIEQEALFPPGAGELPTLKLSFLYRALLPQSGVPSSLRRLRYQDENFPGRTGWKEIIAIPESGIAFQQSSVPATDRSQQLSHYPTDLQQSPPQVLDAHVVFVSAATADGETIASLAPQAGDITAVPRQPNQQEISPPGMASLMAPEHLSLRVILMALAVAMGLGAFHALEPGHGKTVVAAYLVGARGTAQHALWLGLIVTATHTAGVYLLGTVTLFASAYIVPEQLYPWLSAASGLLITGLGIYLFWQRYVGTNGTYTHSHDHVYGHSHAHTHAHEHVFAHAHAHPHTSGHHHADHEHHASHDHPTSTHHHHGHAHPASVTFRQLLTLGVTGGIVPCPAALVVLLSAVALQRINFGLLLIVAFSAGLAAVLIAIGLLMVYARRFMSHFQGEGHLITRWLPLTSAALITVFGVVMIGQALVSAGILAFHL